MASDLKKCWKCRERKPREEFHRCSERKDGRQTHCKACSKARDFSVYSADRRLREYGLTKTTYQALLDEQENRCVACDRPFEAADVCVDHCHRTGEVRGLLCRGCNVALGYAEENPRALRGLAEYIERFAPHPL